MGKKKQSNTAVAESGDDIADELDSIFADETETPKKVAKKPVKDDIEDELDIGLEPTGTSFPQEDDEEKPKSKKTASKAAVEMDATDHFMIDMDKIVITDDPLRTIPNEDLEELAASIKNDGQLQPVLIGTDGVLIDGHRRLLAMQKLGEEQIGARIIDVKEDHRDIIALVANTQRKQLSTQDEGNAFKKLLEDTKRFPSQKALAKALGISEAKVTFTLKAIGASRVSATVKDKPAAKDAAKTKVTGKTHRMSEENLPGNVTVLVSKHEVNLGIKIKIKNEAHAKSFTLQKEVAAILKEISNSEFCKEMTILREDL